jgi:hypothetical protein
VLFDGGLLDNTTITLNVGINNVSNIQSRFLGSPIIEKTGAGKLTLIPALGRDNEIDLIRILGGTFEASQGGLGGADVFIGTGGTLVFAAPAATDNFIYGLTITTDPLVSGKIEKSGPGTVDLTGAIMTGELADFIIRDGGVLKVSTTALDGILPVATLFNDSTLSILVDANEELDASGITGEGNLELRGAFTIDLVIGQDGSPGYDGATRLRDGVTVALQPSTGTSAAIFGGLDTALGTTLVTSGVDSAEFVLNGPTNFTGSLTGTADFIVSGDGELNFFVEDMGGVLDSYNGSVEISGAAAILSISNQKEITLNEGGRIEFRGPGSNYNTSLLGDGTGTVALRGVTLDLVNNPTSLDDGFIARVDLLAGTTVNMVLQGESFTDLVDVSLAGGTLNVTLVDSTGTIALVSPPVGLVPGGSLNLTTNLPSAAVTITGNIGGGLNLTPNITAIAQGNLAGTVNLQGGTLQLGISNVLVSPTLKHQNHHSIKLDK